jgi:hypothetical protein
MEKLNLNEQKKATKSEDLSLWLASVMSYVAFQLVFF